MVTIIDDRHGKTMRGYRCFAAARLSFRETTSEQRRNEGGILLGEPDGQLQRHFGLLQATALNMTMIVGAGVFITIPYMLGKLPGPYAVLGWLAAGALILVDGLIWSELGAALPGSGG